MKKLFLLASLLLAGTLFAEMLKIDPAKADIVLPKNAGGVAKVAAWELQKHLKLLTDVEIPIKETAETGRYAFRFDGVPAGKTLKPEEAVWEIKDDSTIFYGDDTTYPAYATVRNIILGEEEKMGTLSAVDEFLEKQFGVKWLWAGDDGIAAPKISVLKLETGTGGWAPQQLKVRQMGPGYGMWKWASYEKALPTLPEAFHLNKKRYEDKAFEARLWLRRMGMGWSVKYSTNHAFSDWWAKYGKSHPEYFSLQPDGVRRPQNPNSPHSVKLCVSNPAVVKQVVENWRAAGMPSSINTCENDSRGYCRCSKCLKLDVVLPSEKPLSELKPEEENQATLTDRYVYFTNAVMKEARKYRPDVVASMFGYSNYAEPPRREKLLPNINVVFVPFMMDSFDLTDTRYKKWREAGATLMVHRPNDQYVNVCIPMGFEKRIYDHFQLAVKNGVYATHYDSLHGFWQANGVADYVLARLHRNPSASFDSLMNEYCSAFGAAAPEMKEYFNYWRINLFEKLMKDASAISKAGTYGHYGRGILQEFIKKYYTAADFDKTDAILEVASKKDLNEFQRGILKKYQIANRHGRLIFEAVTSKGLARTKKGAELFKFRAANRDNLDMAWDSLTELEYSLGDPTGVREGQKIAEYNDVAETNFRWYFKLDPQNVGLTEKWQEKSAGSLKGNWELLRVDLAWERQPANIITPKLFMQLKNYDGVGWYATAVHIKREWKGKDIFMLFGGVDESAWVYLDGKFCGKRVFNGGNEWLEPFAIKLNDQIDWNKRYQIVTVRVQDVAGLGGIYKRPYLVAKDNPNIQKYSSENLVNNPQFKDNFKGYLRNKDSKYNVTDGILNISGAPEAGKSNSGLLMSGAMLGVPADYSGKTCRLSFSAKTGSISGRLMIAVREAAGKKFAKLHQILLQEQNANTDWKEYSIEFICQDDVKEMLLQINPMNLSAQDQIQIKDIKVVRK
jgi:hypothetical protein